MQNKGKKRKDSLKENAKKMRKKCEVPVQSLQSFCACVCVSSVTSHILLLSLYSFIKCFDEMSHRDVRFSLADHPVTLTPSAT